MKDFNEQLKKAMQDKGITQAELCKKTGITKSAMSQYLTGAFKPKQKRTYLLAKALNVSEAWLMGMEAAEMERRDASAPTPEVTDIKQTQLLSNFNQLNDTGKTRLLEYSDDLVTSGKYSILTEPNQKRA